MVKIDDANFQGPSTINLHPCMTSSRWLKAVPESVVITNVCQDSNITSLVIIDITLVGAWLFTPEVRIISVDGDTSYGSNGTTAPLAVGHFRNPNIPINTNCMTFNGQLVFDFGAVIPNYSSTQVIIFELVMYGQVPLSYGVSFPNQTARYYFEWQKGVLPSPVALSYNNGHLSVEFGYERNVDCLCEIQCFTPTGISFNLEFCPNETQSVVLYQGNTSGDPFSVIMELRDSLGNTSSLEFQSMYTAKPAAPIAAIGTKPKRVNVSINRLSINGAPFSQEVEYQILKYHGSDANIKIWKDWSTINWDNFVDYDIIPGETYGYAVRYKGLFDDVSEKSDWTEITI